MGVKEEIIRAQKNSLKEAKMHEDYEEYFVDIRDNWQYKEMGEEHKRQYSRGSGGELGTGKDGKPPKMANLRSSSSMTYNILGNYTVTIKENCHGLIPGEYRIEYEKQMFTLKYGIPANLDAFLFAGEHAIFCEMKMLEWICDTPKALRSAYKEISHYFMAETNNRCAEEFIKIIDSVEKEMIRSAGMKKDERKIHFQRYDAWQMFKHILAIYNHLSAYTGKMLRERQKQRQDIDVDMAGRFKTATLVNVVFEASTDIFSDKSKKRYLELLQEEHEERDKFLEIIKKSELHRLFKEDCRVDFRIEYMTAAEFIDCLDKTEKEKEYLRRY